MKTLVIGIDGGTWELLQPMLDEDKLPMLAQLQQASAWGTLRSTVPFVSPVAWASFMTGRNPGKHRILDFTRRINGRRLPVNATMLQGKTLWRILSEAGKQVGVINVPTTFPPEPVNGFLISGFPMPQGTRTYTHPESLAAELEAHGWDLADIAGQTSSRQELDEFIQGLYRRQEQRIQATLWLMKHREWDLMMVHLFESDRIQHEITNYWRAWKDGARDDPLAQRFGPEMERFFQALDEGIGRLWEKLQTLDPDSTLVVMSDHGFGPTYRAAHLHNWLVKTGFMHFKRSPLVGFKRMLFRLGITPANAIRLVPQAIRRQLRSDRDVTTLEQRRTSSGPVRALARLLRKLANSLLLSLDDVDWSRTRAYPTGDSGIVHIVVNLEGREPHGSVPPEAYESTRTELVAALRAWRDPYDQGPVVADIYRREEIYSGPFVQDAADILALFRDDSYYVAYVGPFFISNRVIDPRNTLQPDRATHRMNGLVLIHDARVVPGERIQANIVDLAPTLLYLMDLPIPSNMDGSLIRACFGADWLATHPPQMVQVAENTPAQASGLTTAEEASMLDMLRDLGYVE